MEHDLDPLFHETDPDTYQMKRIRNTVILN